MNSPTRNFAATRRPVFQYDGSYDNRAFVPAHRGKVGDYECVKVLPEDGSFFYRMDGRKAFAFSREKGSNVFSGDRNIYFGFQPKDLMNAYKTHTHLYVVMPNKPIMLLDMGIAANVNRLIQNVPAEIGHSIRTAFPIYESVVKRYSVPAENHNDGIDHDRRLLDYICRIPGIDGYYVAVEGHHPEIGFCKGSLGKLDVVDMFRIRTEERQRENRTRGLKRKVSRFTYDNAFPSTRGRISMLSQNGEDGEDDGPSFMSRLGFEGGKRRKSRRRRTIKKCRTHRK